MEKADKRSIVVVLDKQLQAFIAEGKRQLIDDRFYKKLDSDPTEEFSALSLTPCMKMMK